MWKFLKRILFKFDAEQVHHFVILLISIGIRLKNIPLRIVSGGIGGDSSNGSIGDADKQYHRCPRVFGMEFCSRVGLAAGFDKNCEVIEGLPALGFGFAEIGTVTPRPQPGNERPRMFRIASETALFNRLGFNNLGAEIVAERLAAAKSKLPVNFRVGVNVGKNKDTPLEEARKDYYRAASCFKGLADYLVINVSSPNTPGLRSLQTLESLKPIVHECMDLVSGWAKFTPLLIKLSPEFPTAMQEDELEKTIKTIESWGIQGWVLTNTLAGTYPLKLAKNLTELSSPPPLQGGWSGNPVRELSKKSLLETRKFSQKPVISVGGITSTEEAVSRIRAGADLIQIYTGWVFHGPRFPRKLDLGIARFESQEPQNKKSPRAEL